MPCVRGVAESAGHSPSLFALDSPPVTHPDPPRSHVSQTNLLDLPYSHLTMNPLFAPTPLSLAPRAPAMPAVADFLCSA